MKIIKIKTLFLKYLRSISNTGNRSNIPKNLMPKLLREGDWIDDEGIYHHKRNWRKITKNIGNIKR